MNIRQFHVSTITATLLTAWAFFMAPAAEALVCGETIYSNTVMTHDLVGCAGHGLVIGEDGVELDLNGHLISGSGTGTGILISSGFSKARIQGPGKIENFHVGISAQNSSRHEVLELTVVGAFGTGISFSNVEDSFVYGTEVVAATHGIALQGSSPASRNRVIENSVSNCMGYGSAIAAHAGDDHVIEGNDINGCEIGISLQGTSRVSTEGNVIFFTQRAISLVSHIGPMAENRLLRNKIYQNGNGIVITSGAAGLFPVKETVVQENAFEGGIYGLYLEDPLVSTTLFLDNHLSRVRTPLFDSGSGTVSSGNFCDGFPC